MKKLLKSQLNSEYRKKGIASSLTAGLALEILKRIVPAWVEMTIKPISIVDDMNKLEKE